MVDITDPIYRDAIKARARQGRLSPQEHAKLIDIGYYFDVEEKPVAPPIAIQIVQNFPDADRAEQKQYVVGPETKR